MSENSYKPIIQDARNDLKLVLDDLRELDGEILKISQNIRKNFQGVFNINNGQSFTTVLENQKRSMTNLNTAVESHKTKLQELIDIRAKNQTLTQGTTKEEARLERMYKRMFDTLSKQNEAYNKLIKRRNEARNNLRNLIASENASRKAIKQAQKEYDTLQKKVNKANKAVSNFSKTSLGGLVRGFRNLLGAFGVVGAIQLFAGMTQQGFKLAKKLDSLNFAMSTLITNEEELARTQFFLKDITERYGAEIVTTTERYIKFLTAAEQSKIPLAETEKIFASVTKAAGVLGLSTEELNGTYLALEQMLSKGKVTTEELRRQLGERLPGAFGIMADAIGVSIEELDKMLKKGEVLSKDALPKFAEALEEAYKIENIDNVVTLQAETSRLSNAWTNFVGNVTKSEGVISKALIGILGLITDIVEGLNVINQTTAEMSEELFQDSFQNTMEWYNDIAGYEDDRIARIKNIVAVEKVGAEEKKKLQEEILKNEEMMAFEAQRVAKERRSQALANITNLQAEKSQLEKNLTKYDDYSWVAKNIRSEYRVWGDELEKVERKLARERGALKATEQFLKGNTEATIDNTEAKEDGRRTLADVRAEIKQQQEALSDSTKEEAKAILDKIDVLKEEEKAWLRLRGSKKKNRENDDEYDLSVSRLKIQIASNKDIADNEDKHFATRLLAQEKYYQYSLALIKLEEEKKKEEYKGREDAITRVEEEAENKRKQLRAKNREAKSAIEVSDFDKRLQEFEKLQDKENVLLEKHLLDVEETLRARGKSEEEIAKEVEEIRRKSQEKMLNDFLDYQLKELMAQAKTEEQKLALIQKSNEIRAKLNELMFGDTVMTEEKVQEKIKEISRELIDELKAITINLFAARVQAYEDDIQRNRDYYAELLDNESLSQEQREALNDERDRKERELEQKKRKAQRKQARFEKALSAAEIIVKTKEGVMNYASKPVTAPLVPYIIALGAAQLAGVLATPIPQYFGGKGKYDNYEGPAIWGERRREAKINPRKGTFQLSPKRIGNHLTHVEKDDIIHPDADKLLRSLSKDEVDQFIHHNMIIDSIGRDTDDLMQFAMLKEIDNSISNQTKQILSGLSQIGKSKKPVHINNVIDISSKLNYQAYKNDTL